MKIAFFTLGCKVNQYESQILAQNFADAGYEVVPPDAPADVYVLNSCTVTASGDQKTRRTLRRFKKLNPAARVALTGCFPQAFPDAAERMPEADIITGARDRARLVELVERCLKTGERIVSLPAHTRDEPFERMQARGAGERTRAFLKIEDGCERYCAYCIIPKARGPVRSKTPEALREELEALCQSGYREVVLVGINLSCYGTDLGLGLLDAVEAACSVPGIERVRLGSLEPELLSRPVVARLARQEKLCPQFHLSLQSGCDQTLRRMNRHYTCGEYAQIVTDLRTHFKNCAVTTDIMVGFPGETEEEFNASMAFAEEISFAKAHVFSYSRRPGTRAADMPGQIPRALKEERAARMAEATLKTRAAFLKSQEGRLLRVLFERAGPDGMQEGYTENYLPVRLRCARELRGQILPVRITESAEDYCIGKLETV